MASETTKNNKAPKPILKWAGGKTQLLCSLLPLLPKEYGKYIEPFFGGGALFFAANPKTAIIADRNPELINLYQQIAHNVDAVIEELSAYKNDSNFFYELRDKKWESMEPYKAAARTIYLNKTCFNGLYRVNKHGQFNTPYGRYKNPKICDPASLLAASKALKKATIVCGDYLDVLKKFAKPGDFVFLDPPYIPVGKYGDFKRYTKEQFHEEDQIDLAREVDRLVKLGCNVILTNSNHPLVHELYSKYRIEIVPSKRAISSNAKTRTSEDAIVVANQNTCSHILVSSQTLRYPRTRFMGSKQKLIEPIWEQASRFSFSSVIDLFSGSGAVGYMFKAQGKRVISNDYLYMSAVFAKAMIENNYTTLPLDKAKKLMVEHGNIDTFVEDTFRGLYFTDYDNRFIDIVRTNILSLNDEYERAIAMTALIRACMKKRPRGLFTYTGNRYDDGRKDLKLSFEEQFIENVRIVNEAVFDNGQGNVVVNGNSLELEEHADLVYMDPPYFTPGSDNEYVRRYHFVEGLARYWKGVDIQQNTSTKKFKNYPTPFSTKNGAFEAFDLLFKKYKDSVLIVSYSSNSIPTKDEMVDMLKKYKANVEVIPIDYTYFFGNQTKGRESRSKVQEFLFVAY